MFKLFAILLVTALFIWQWPIGMLALLALAETYPSLTAEGRR